MIRGALLIGCVLCWWGSALWAADANVEWAASLKLPSTEKAIKLFDGQNLTGWEGQIAKYWSVENGMIKATNTMPVPVSTYLFTKERFRNFRLLMEVKQTRGAGFSTMHSAIGVLGEKYADHGDEFSFKGPLLMFCNDWGIWDANRRNRIYPPKHGGVFLVPSEKIGDWNRIEVLVIGEHIRMVNNGQMVIDFKDEPAMLRESPIGLQLHSNGQKQEYRFRGLIAVKDPTQQLLTLDTEAQK